MDSRRLVLLGCLLTAVLGTACGSAPDEAEPVVTPQQAKQPAPAPDPRIAEMQVLLAELLDRIEVLNARLQRMESGTSGLPAGSAPVESAPAAPRPPATSRPQSTTPPASQPSQQAVARPQTPRVPLSGGALAQKYRTGIELFAKGQLDNSRAAFQEVLDADPNGDLADNALYWIAETHFVAARYAEAVRLYQRIVNDYSDENKAPDAMFKMGLAYAKLGDLVLARNTLQQLIQKYPYSTPASTAKLEIERIKY